MAIFASLICLLSLLVATPSRARAVEYRLQVANLIDDAFVYYVKGPIGRGEGELALDGLEHAIDAGQVNRGGLVYDRDVFPAGDGVARSFAAAPVRPAGASTSEAGGLWKTVTWDGTPGDRVVWIVRAATTMHRRGAADLALEGPAGGLRYFLPYRVTVNPRPARVVAYSLAFLRSGENGRPLWERWLSRAVDLDRGLAAVVGLGSVDADWVYVVMKQPPEPATFRVALGWAKLGSGDRVIAGAGGGNGISLR